MENNLLWSEDDVEVSEDGFLLIKHSKEGKLDEEDQPLLLHTTDRLLRSLYPSLSMGEIFQHSGYSDEEATTNQTLDDEKRRIQSSDESSENLHGDEHDVKNNRLRLIKKEEEEEEEEVSNDVNDNHPSIIKQRVQVVVKKEEEKIDMEKHEKSQLDGDGGGTPKDIANRMKSRGLQELKFYCQMCEKQCRDQNGLKQHATSESHMRQMKIFTSNADNDDDDQKRAIPPSDNTEKNENDGDDNDDGKKKPIPIEYRSYQNLVREENLSNRIISALLDIRNFRHQINKSQSWTSKKKIKIRALHHQQQRLLQVKNGSGISNVNNEIDTTAEESITIKLVRTTNSIRALFPHLLPILNHTRRNDKNLLIKKVRYKTKRNGAMCWLLGTMSFGTTTCKQCIAAYDDVTRILESFIDTRLAKEISKDSKGSPTFWTSLWIEHIIKRSKPSLPSPLKILSVSSGKSEKEIEQMAHICDTKIHYFKEATGQGIDQQYQTAVTKIHKRLSNVLTSRFQGARLSIYGSCLSNLSLGKGSDVDMSLWIPEANMLKKGFHDGSLEALRYESGMTKLVYQVFRKLNNSRSEFRGMTPITKARIPVITGTYIYAGNPFTEDGSINFDICFLNDIAVANSSLLREYSLVDHRVRSLMMTVKQWAKEHKINSAKEKCISSYTWMNLVIFYLQCIGFIPNLQSPILSKAAGIVSDPDKNYWHFVNRLDTFYLRWEVVRDSKVWTMPREFDELPLSILLYGFFEFYSSRFPFGTHAVSIKRGNISLSKLSTRKIGLFFSIEDPFETYDSHCPHDLGTPANEYGSKKIMDCFRDAEDYLRNILWSDKNPTDDRLWPKPESTRRELTRSNARKSKSGFKRFERPLSNINGAPTSHNTDRGEKSTSGSGGNQKVHSKPPHVGMNKNQSARVGNGNGIGNGNDDSFGRRNREPNGAGNSTLLKALRGNARRAAAKKKAANTRNETLSIVNNTSEK